MNQAIVNFMGLLMDSYWGQLAVAIFAGLALLSFIVLLAWRWRMKRLVEQRNELSLAVMLRTREIQRES